jgi:hypothetical protein
MQKACCGAQMRQLTALPHEKIVSLHATAGQGTIAKPLGKPTENGHRLAATPFARSK